MMGYEDGQSQLTLLICLKCHVWGRHGRVWETEYITRPSDGPTAKHNDFWTSAFGLDCFMNNRP